MLGSYSAAFERIEHRLEEFDVQAMRGDSEAEHDIERLIEMRRQVGKLRRALAAHRSALVALTYPELEALGDYASGERYQSLLRRFESTVQEARDAREAIVGSFDVLIARGGQRTNEIMKVLTLASVILLPGRADRRRHGNELQGRPVRRPEHVLGRPGSDRADRADHDRAREALAVDLNDASAWRLELARRYIEPYRERAAIAVLGGSVAQGVADRWSDIDTILYWDEIDRDWLETPRAGADGDRFTWVEHYPGNACLEQYRFGTVKADVAHVRLGWLDELIDGTLSGESFDTTSLDVLRGVQESIVLFGEERYEPIRARVLDYPDSLRRAMVEANLKVTPSWIYDGMGRDRGDLVVFYEYVLATMRYVVGILAGLNRVYIAPEKLKRVGAVVGRMELTPPDAAARLDALLDLPREQVRAELDDLVGATLDLVEEHLPDVDTTRARRLWSLPAEPSEGGGGPPPPPSQAD